MASNEDMKKQLAEAYTRSAGKYGTTRNRKFDAFLEHEMDQFICRVKKIGVRIVDLGSGPGNESVYFQAQGLQPICVDISAGMAQQCQKRELQACMMDFYHLAFPNQFFAGAWMCFSLLHVPKKRCVDILQEVYRVLVIGGILHVALFEGEGEGPREEDRSKFGIARYFAYYKADELEAVLTPYFKVINISRLNISPRPTLSIECSKKG